MGNIEKFEIRFFELEHRYMIGEYYGSVIEIGFFYKGRQLKGEYDICNPEHFYIEEHELKKEFLSIAKKFIKTEEFQRKVTKEYQIYIEDLKKQLKTLGRKYEVQEQKNKILAIIEKYNIFNDPIYLENKRKKLEKMSINKIEIERKKAFLVTLMIEAVTEKGEFRAEFMINDGKIDWDTECLVHHVGGECKFCKYPTKNPTCYWFFGLEFDFLKKVMNHPKTRIKGMMLMPEYYKILNNQIE